MFTLLLILYVAVMLAAGFLLMRRLDRFLHGGGFHPYWDEEEERRLHTAQNEKNLHEMQKK